MKRYRKFFLAFVVMVMLVQPMSLMANTSVSVTGEATVNVAPDIVTVTVGVMTQDESLTAAVSDNSEAIEAIVEAAVAFGAAPQDISTSSFWVSQMGIWDEALGSLEVFRVENMLNVSFRDVDAVNDLLLVLIDAGATNIWNINFDIENRTNYYLQALALAIADGFERAEAIAGALNRPLGELVTVEEQAAWGVMPGMGALLFATAQDAGVGVQAPNTVGVSASVRMVFE